MIQIQHSLTFQQTCEPIYSFAIKGNHKNIYYICKVFQEKLNLVPVYENGNPIKLNRFLLNDIKIKLKEEIEKQGSINGIKICFGFDIFSFSCKIDSSIAGQIQKLSFNQNEVNRQEIMKLLFSEDYFMKIDDSISKLCSILRFQKRILVHSKHSKAAKLSKKVKLVSETHQIQLLIRKKLFQIQKILQQRRDIIKQIPINKVCDDNTLKNCLNQTSDDVEKNSLRSQNIPLIKNIELQQTYKFPKIIGGVSSAQKVIANKLEYSFQDKVFETETYPIQLMKKQIRQLPSSCSKQGNHHQNAVEINLFSRFNRELQMVNHLNHNSNKSYLLNYYDCQRTNANPKNQYYIQFADMNITEFLLEYKQKLGILQLLGLCLQVVRIVKDLHNEGIVHRDLKPDNLMVKRDPKTGKFSLKLIDFSDSAYISDQLVKPSPSTMIFGTLPFSPIETEKTNKNYLTKGFNKKQIDYWSVGILIQIIFYGKSPISFSSNFWKQINSLWENEFLVVFRRTKSHNFHLIDYVFQKLMVHMLRVPQQKRMEVEKAEEILKLTIRYYQNLLKSQFGSQEFQFNSSHLLQFY